jgi:hypothetical protein
LTSSLRRIVAVDMVDSPSTTSQPQRGSALSVAHSLSVVSSNAVCPLPAERQALRAGLGELRAGQEELEEFVISLFEGLDAAWTEVEEDHARLKLERQKMTGAQADFSARRTQWEYDHRQRNDALQHRVVELEKDRLVLKVELESARSQATDLLATLNELQRQIAAERTEWNLELRMLRDVLDRQASSGFVPNPVRAELQNGSATIRSATPASAPGAAAGRDATATRLPPFLPAHLTPGPLPRAIPSSKDAPQRATKAAGALAAGSNDPILGPLVNRFAKIRAAELQPNGAAFQAIADQENPAKST